MPDPSGPPSKTFELNGVRYHFDPRAITSRHEMDLKFAGGPNRKQIDEEIRTGYLPRWALAAMAWFALRQAGQAADFGALLDSLDDECDFRIVEDDPPEA